MAITLPGMAFTTKKETDHLRSPNSVFFCCFGVFFCVCFFFSAEPPRFNSCRFEIGGLRMSHLPCPLLSGLVLGPQAKKRSSGDLPDSMRHPAALAEPRATRVEPSWNLVEPGGTLVDRLTSGPPRTTPEPIWAETPKL